MADERTDIIITDRVAPTIAPHIEAIGEAARRSSSAIEQLQQAITANSARAASATAQLQQAANNNARAQLAAAAGATRNATATARLQTATVGTATAQQRLATATINTTRAQTQATAATVRLQQAQLRLQQQQQRSAGGGNAGGLGSGVVAAVLGRSVLSAVDSYQLLENKIRSVTKTEQERIQVQQRLLEISNSTFQSTDATATLYQRLSSATARLGISQNQVFDVVTNVSKAFALSGATASEAHGAIIQLSQAISSDFKTSSQELNTILEQAPILADVFATQLGHTRAELKLMAKEGLLTSKDFITAFGPMGKGIAELELRFGRLTPAISQAGQEFSNSFQSAAGQLAEATGAAKGLVEIMLFLKDNMYLVITAGTFLFPLLVGGLARSSIAMAAFNTVVRANPIILLLSALVAVGAGLISFAQKTVRGRLALQDLGHAVAGFEIGATLAIASVVTAIDNLIDAWNFVKNGFSWEGVGLSHLADPIVEAGARLVAADREARKLDRTAKQIDFDLKHAANSAGGLEPPIKNATEETHRFGQEWESAGSKVQSTVGATQSGLTEIKNSSTELAKHQDALQASAEASLRKGAQEAMARGTTYRDMLHNTYDISQGVANVDFSTTLNGLKYSADAAAGLAQNLQAAAAAANNLGGIIQRVGTTPGAYGTYATSGGGQFTQLHRTNAYTGPTRTIGGEPPKTRLPPPKYDYASGGRISGPGTGTSDSIPIMASNGEFVVNADDTRKHEALLQAINNSEIRHYAEGGRVSNSGKGIDMNIPNSGVYGPGSQKPITGYDPFSILAHNIGLNKDDLRASGYGFHLNISKQAGIVPFLVYRGPEQFSAEIKDSLATSAANIEKWQGELSKWWRETKPTIEPSENRMKADNIVDKWNDDLKNFMVDPFPVTPDGNPRRNPNYGQPLTTFGDARQSLASAGWAGGIVNRAPPYSETLGKYVQYRGPNYGGVVNYGGDPTTPLDFSKPPPEAEAKKAFGLAMLNGLPIGKHIKGGIGLAPRGTFTEFAEGGSFMVPGTGGPDSRAVAMMVTPGEEISVRTPAQQENSEGIHGRKIEVTLNVNGVTDAASFKRSQAQIIADLHRRLAAYERTQ